MNQNKEHWDWFRLDNAAAVFPGQNMASWSNVIRISVDLEDPEPVDPAVLQSALETVLPRFPSMNVRLRSGLFWHYFERNPHIPVVRQDTNNQCLHFNYQEDRGFLLRVFYYRNRIALEVFHALTDGYGCAVFLNTLTAEYLRQKGHAIPAGGMVLNLHDAPSAGELEDSFLKYASNGKLNRPDAKVYHRKGVRLPKHTLHIISGHMSVQELRTVSKSYGATLTEFFTAVLLELYIGFQKAERARQKNVSIQVPVNGRNQFSSQTLRNFTVCYDVRLDPRLGYYTFEEIINQVSLYMRYINNEKTLGAMYHANVGLMKNPVLRVLPLFIKDFGIALGFRFTAEHSNTSLFTNLGRVCVPAEMEPLVRSYLFMPTPGMRNGGRIGAVSIGDRMTVTFSNCYEDTDVERAFFTRLVKMGIHVKIESNLEGS